MIDTDRVYLGIGARRALSIIIGGRPEPSKDERMSNEEFAEWIRAADIDVGETNDYEEAARRLAKIYLVALEEGIEGDESWDVWDAIERRWPRLAAQAKEMTAFQHDWAFSIAKKLLEMSERNISSME